MTIITTHTQVEQLQEQLAEHTDFRQAEADVYTEWGTAGYHGQDRQA
jgi:hypothetical protein